MQPETAYAMSGDLSIAFQVVGQGEHDLIFVPGYASHLDLDWQFDPWARFIEGLASFARVLLFDKRGTGLSDRIEQMPTLEERMDDVRAVMDAAGSERAVLFGVSEGAPMSILFAATYPERTTSLVLYGGMARSTAAPDYPYAAPVEAINEAAREWIVPYLYTGEDLEYWMPSLGDDPTVRALTGRHRRSAVSPSAFAMLHRMFLEIDVRSVLSSVTVPTLVLHRRGDRIVNRRAGEWMASQMPGATYMELPGQDHFPWVGDPEAVLTEIASFVTGERRGVLQPERELRTIMFTDIVGSTERAAQLGDAAWRKLLEDHGRAVAVEIERHRGARVKSLGDGVLATFDGPGRGVRCALAIVDAGKRLGLDLRIGLHCGEVEIVGDDVAGIAVHIASRVSAIAGAGQVVVSGTIPGLVGGSDLRFEDLGAHALSGIDAPMPLFVVIP